MNGKNEQEWLIKFYEGTFLVKGWTARIKEILHDVPWEHKEEIEIALTGLGEKIGQEWAKDNDIRRIDSDMLRKWGEELRSVRKKGNAVLKETIRKIDSEADSIIKLA